MCETLGGYGGMLPQKILKISVLSNDFSHSESIIIPFWLTTYDINCVIFFLNI